MIASIVAAALWIFLSTAWPALLGVGCLGTWGRANVAIFSHLWSKYQTVLVLIWAVVSSLPLSFTEEAVQALTV